MAGPVDQWVRTITWLFLLASVVSMPAGLVHAAGQPQLNTGSDAQRSFDGLYRVENSRLDAAWMRKGVDLSRYSKLLVRRGGAALWSVDWSAGRPGAGVQRPEASSPITDRNHEKLAEALRREALAELAEGERFQLADAPGDDVLLLVIGMVDVISQAAGGGSDGAEAVLHSVTEATLVLELRDSMTDAVLARATDRRVAGTLHVQPVGTVAVDGELKRLSSSWGRLLRERLDDLMAAGEAVARSKQ